MADQLFLANNRGPNILASLLWETLQGDIRGEIISDIKFELKLPKEKMSILTCPISQPQNCIQNLGYDSVNSMS